MKAVIKKWRQGAHVRIPASVMDAAGLKLDQTVNVREESRRIIIEPLTSRNYELEELLAGITADNIHAEIDFGSPHGKEWL